MFFDECGAKGLEYFAELRDESCADELFYGGLFFGFGVYVDFELGLLDYGYLGVVVVKKRTTYSLVSVSWATSGTVTLPLTSSPSFVLPVWIISTVYTWKGLPRPPSYSRPSLTSNIVMTLPFLWLTSTSPSIDVSFEILADAPSSSTVHCVTFSVR
jgi:hypothetical protein